MKPSQCHGVYRQLYKQYGPQSWWPAKTPFEVIVGAVLTQNTAWSNVEQAIANLRDNNALTAEAIARAHGQRLAGWIRPSGYFNVKARRLKSVCQWLLAQGGVEALSTLDTGQLRPALLEVHGIGPETADDILLYAFERPVFVIDTYTRRIFSRLRYIHGKESYETLRVIFERHVGEDIAMSNEYHALIVRHAKEHCRKAPRCEGCCLRRRCGYGRDKD